MTKNHQFSVRHSITAERLPVLDGWRGLSILLVLATHLLPLGPKIWRLNETAGPLGMALFFTLSGFLITAFLLREPSAISFIVRRISRIIPLAWLYLVIILAIQQSDLGTCVANFLFYGNIPPFYLTSLNGHFWSLCVEFHFYTFVFLLVLFLTKNGLYLLPLFSIFITLYRIYEGETINIITWFRADEILAGTILAIAYHHNFSFVLSNNVRCIFFIILSIMAIVSSHPLSGWVQYFRPYIVASLVGMSLMGSVPKIIHIVLTSSLLAYIAAISYALYIIHPLLDSSWLGNGQVLAKYLKRPLLFVVLFIMAHVSTFYFEARFIAYGRQLAEKFERKF